MRVATYYFPARQKDEIEALVDVGVEAIYLEYSGDGRWSFENDFGGASLLIRYKKGDWEKFVEGVELWADFIDGIILPRGKKYDGEVEVYYDVETIDDLVELMNEKYTNFYITKDLWLRNNLRIRRTMKRNGIMEDVKVIIHGSDLFHSKNKHIVGVVVYPVLDNSIAKRVFVYRGQNRELRNCKEMTISDMEITYRGLKDLFSIDDIRNCDFKTIFKYNAFVYLMKEVKKKPSIPRWVVEYERLKKEGNLPEWANEYDKRGNLKAIYLYTRYGRLKHGLYAKKLVKENIICDTCPIRDVCPFYTEGGVCVYTPIWKKIGDTRNVEFVIKKMEELIAEEWARYMRAVYIEGMSGDVANKSITQLGDVLMKHLEIYDRLLRGRSGVDVGGKIDLDISISLDEALQNVRKRYGDELAKKIEERLNDEEED